MLVRVHASSVTRSDCGLRDPAEYFFARVFTGLVRPKRTIAGMEFAGVVEEVGAGVTAVRGRRRGLRDQGRGERGVRLRPRVGRDRAQAVAAQLRGRRRRRRRRALGVHDAARARADRGPAHRRLRRRRLHRDGGGAGRQAPRRPTSPRSAARSRSSSCARSARTRSSTTCRRTGRDSGTYDGVLDAVGKSSFRKARRALKPGAAYVSADLGYLWHLPLLILPTRWLGSRRRSSGSRATARQDLIRLRELIEAGGYRPVIDRTYPLEDVVEAARYVETRQKTGNVVLTVNGGQPR